MLGPATQGTRTYLTSGDDLKLRNDERADFRQMAAHPYVVEEVIAASSDDRPAPRRQVTGAIHDRAIHTAVESIREEASDREPFFAALRVLCGRSPERSQCGHKPRRNGHHRPA